MATGGMIGYNTLLQQFTGSYTTIAEVISISAIGFTVDSIDSTSMDSASSHKEAIIGLSDTPEFSAELVYKENTYSQLFGYRRTSKQWKVIFPDGSFVTWTGFITKLEGDFSVADKASIKISIKPTDLPVFTTA